MADLFWPADIHPSAVEWKLIDSTAVFTSPLTGATRTVSRGGLRWQCSLAFENLSTTQRARALGTIAALKGRQNRLWLHDASQSLGGSFPAVETLSNVDLTATTGWTAGAEVSAYADGGRLRSTRTAVTADSSLSSQATVTAGVQYLFRALAIAGKGSMSYDLRLGSTAGASDITNGTNLTAAGYQYVTGSVAGTTMHAGMGDLYSGRSVDGYQSIAIPSLARCALVKGASQTGSALLIDALPTSTDGLLLAGDMVSVYTSRWELKRVTAALNSNGSGEGYLQFEPPLSTSPSDNAPIAIYRPTARFLLSEDDPTWSTRPGLFSDVSLTLIEDLVP